MKSARVSGTLGLVALAMASHYAVAADSGWYAGFNVGQSRADIANDRIRGQLLGAGLTMTGITNDDRDTGYKLFGGYRFHRNFALEGGYFDLGEFGFTATTVPVGTLTGNIRLRGLNLDLVGIVPITEKFSAFGRAGVNYAEARDTFTGTGVVTVANRNPSERDTNYKFGAGLQYDFNQFVGMRAEAERYRINDAVGNKGDIDLFSLGLVFRFGGKTPAPAPQAAPPAPTPAPVAAPPPPPPAVKSPPPQVVTPPPPPPPAPAEKAPRKDRN